MKLKKYAKITQSPNKCMSGITICMSSKQSQIYQVVYCCFVLLGMGSWVSHMLDKPSTTKLYTPSPTFLKLKKAKIKIKSPIISQNLVLTFPISVNVSISVVWGPILLLHPTHHPVLSMLILTHTVLSAIHLHLHCHHPLLSYNLT